MLEQVLLYLKNFFIVENGVHEGKYAIKDGKIDLPFVQKGQYFRILGSVFNDGVYQYTDSVALHLTDETFDGVIWALAIPKAVVKLAEDIEAWEARNAQDTPFVSESFGGYSYSRATNSSGQPAGWQDIFASRLAPYKKLREYGAIQPGVGV